MTTVRPNFSEISSLHSHENNFEPKSNSQNEEKTRNFDKIIREVEQFSDQNKTAKDDSSSKNSSPKSNSDAHISDESVSEKSLAMDDKDARRLLIANYIRKRMEQIAAEKMKPGCEQFKDVLDVMETAKTVLFGLMLVFVLFSRPEWCTNLKSGISYDCVQILDPNQQVKIVKSWIPILSSSTKYLICMISMILVCIFQACKVGFTVSNKEERGSCILSIGITVINLFFNGLHLTGIYIFTGMDLFIVLFFLVSMPTVRKNMLLFVEIISRSKFVFVYVGLFLLFVSAIFFVLFSGFSDFNDGPSDSYYTFNFESFPNTCFSVVLTAIGNFNSAGIMQYFMQNSITYLVLFILVSFFIKFFIQSYIIAILYYFFSRFFKDNLLDLRKKHPILEAKLTEMVEDDRLSVKELDQALEKYLQPESDRDSIIEMEYFYTKASEKILESALSRNPDSGFTKFSRILAHKSFVYVLALVELMVVLCLIVTVEAEPENCFWIYVFFFAVNFLSVYLRIQTVLNGRVDASSLFDIFGVISCLFINGLIFLTLISNNISIFVQLINLNPVFKKIIGVLMVTKIANLYKLLLKFDQIKMTVVLLVRASRFILDVFMTMVIIMFIYASLGIVLFGGKVNDQTGLKYQEIYGEEFNKNLLLLNFNDYYYAMLTLFVVVFDGITTSLRVNTAENSQFGIWPLLFFLSYFFLLATCLMNILLGFLIDNVAEYLKDHRMEFTKQKYRKLNKLGNLKDDDDNDNAADNGHHKKSVNESENSKFSEDLDVYLNLKKKKPKSVATVIPLNEIKEEEEEKNDKFLNEVDQPVLMQVLSQKTVLIGREREIVVQEPVQIQEESEPIEEVIQEQQNSEIEESVFVGTPVNPSGKAKFNPLTQIVKK